MIDKTIATAKVRGGDLTYADLCSDHHETAPVLALHGLTANHITFHALARALNGRRVVAPDLRGYGRSHVLPGPYGLASHVDDAITLLDHLEVEMVDVVAHSMGASVAVLLAAARPDRVGTLVLVDGGLPGAVPAGMSVAEALRAAMGPTVERLETTFATRAEYVAVRSQHPGLASCWNEDTEEYVNYDLVGEEPQLRSSTKPEALTSDAGDLFDGSLVTDAWSKLEERDVEFVGAERGMLDQAPPVVQRDEVNGFQQRFPRLRSDFVPDSNHFSVLMAEIGAKRIAALLDGSATGGK
jgi:pimeloyl-ACP methyl ester carboxylesterase